MKGITHFASGVAIASCFPYAVQAGADGNPLYFILGGFCALLPDTLDFKVSRFFHKHDVEIAPDPLQADAPLIAEAVADAIHRAQATACPVSVKFNTIRLGTDLWQRYTVRLDGSRRQVEVRYGPTVDTGNQPVASAVLLPGNREATLPLACSVSSDYSTSTVVDIFDGPVLTMVPNGPGKIRVLFLRWHRAWSHSLVIGFLAALLVSVVTGVRAGAVVFAAWASHSIMDQLGFMGCNLFYPFTRERWSGARLAHSTLSLPNLVTVWMCLCIVFWNLSRLRATPGVMAEPSWLLIIGTGLPLLAVGLSRRLVRMGS